MDMPQMGRLDSMHSQSEGERTLPWSQMGRLVSGSGVGEVYASCAEGVLPSPTEPAVEVGSGAEFSTPAQPRAASSTVSGRHRGRGLMVWGLIVAFVLAPLSMMAYVVFSADLFSLSSRLTPVESTSVVQVDTTGGYFLMSLGSGSASHCVLVAGENSFDLEAIPGTTPAWWTQNVPAGEYTLMCDVVGDPGLLGATSVVPANISYHAGVSAVLATFVGITGVVMFIVGLGRRKRS